MDILKEFKDFFLHGGLEEWVYTFRNPPKEVDCMTYSYRIKYIKELNSREYSHYEEEDPEYYTYALCGGVRLSKMQDELRNMLDSKNKYFLREIEKFLIIITDDEEEFNEIKNNSETDFSRIRRGIKENPDYTSFRNELLFYVGKMQLNYENFIEQASKLSSPTKRSVNKQLKSTVNSFGFKGDKRVLKMIYKN